MIRVERLQQCSATARSTPFRFGLASAAAPCPQFHIQWMRRSVQAGSIPLTIPADAMHAQRGTTRAVTDRGGDCALALKGSLCALHEDVRPRMDGSGRLR